jgi:hypothetical protein
MRARRFDARLWVRPIRKARTHERNDARPTIPVCRTATGSSEVQLKQLEERNLPALVFGADKPLLELTARKDATNGKGNLDGSDCVVGAGPRERALLGEGTDAEPVG